MTKTTTTELAFFFILCCLAGAAAGQIRQTDFWLGLMFLTISLKLTLIYWNTKEKSPK